MSALAELYRLETVVDDVCETKIIALADRHFVGCVSVRHIDHTSAGLRQLFVHPGARRLGIGRQLVEECCAIASASGCETIGLSLAPENRGLLADFYERLGFFLGYEYDDASALVIRRLNQEGGAK